MSNLRTYIVRRLDGVDQDYTVDKKCNGSDLLDKVSRVKERAEKENRLSHAVVATSLRVVGERKAIGGLKTACNCHACPEVYFPFQKVPQCTASHLYQYSQLSFEAFRCSIFLVYFNASFSHACRHARASASWRRTTSACSIQTRTVITCG